MVGGGVAGGRSRGEDSRVSRMMVMWGRGREQGEEGRAVVRLRMDRMGVDGRGCLVEL